MKNFMLYILLFLFYANSSLLAQDSQPKFVKWGDCMPGKISREKFISLLDSTIQLNNASSSIQLGREISIIFSRINFDSKMCVNVQNVSTIVRSCLLSCEYPLLSLNKIEFEIRITSLKNKNPYSYILTYMIE